MTAVKQRESSFELLRLISQYMIVIGHVLQVIVTPASGEPFYKAIMFPLHVAVPCFVMISGFFGIKASIKGLVNLLKFVVVLYVPLLLIKLIVMGGGTNDILAIVFPVSRTNTWFIRTYLWLFLLSPLVNKALENSTLQQKFIYALCLFAISNYAGTIGNDVSLTEGKNIVAFLFYYLIGHILSLTKDMWKKIERKKLLFIYVLCNVIIVSLVTIYGGNRIVNGVFEFCFVRYNSPFLWLNAILTFMLITGFSFQSITINKMAKTCLSIYLLHCSFVSWMLVKPVMDYLMSFSNSILFVFASTCFVALMIVFVCIAVHFALSPIWLAFDRIGAYLQDKVDLLWSHYFDKK